MKEFELTDSMLTIGGTFYPKGYAFITFETEAIAHAVAKELETSGGDAHEAMLLSPATILRKIGKTDGESEVDLPSVGTEGATVLKYVKLARKGHWALMVEVPSDEFAEQLMVAARKGPFSYAQRYHLLAMEDLE